MSSGLSMVGVGRGPITSEAPHARRDPLEDPARTRVLRWLYDQGVGPHARHALAHLHDRGSMDDVLTILLQVPEIRRITAATPTGNWPWAPPRRRFVVADLEVDGATREILARGTPLALEPIERTLLEYLVVHEDRVVTRLELLRRVWGGGRFRSRVVDAYVGRLRRKLAGTSVTVATVRGAGYTLSIGGAPPTPSADVIEG